MNIRNAVLFELRSGWLKPSYSVLVRRMKGQSGSAAKGGENSSLGSKVMSGWRSLTSSTHKGAKSAATPDPSTPAKAVTTSDPSPPAKAVSTVKVVTPGQIQKMIDQLPANSEEQHLAKVFYGSQS